VQLCARALLLTFAAAVSISLRNYTPKEQKTNHVAEELGLSGAIMKKVHPRVTFPSVSFMRTVLAGKSNNAILLS
jgi:hypothetical protein